MIHLFKTTFNRQKCKGHTEAVSKLKGVKEGGGDYLLAAVSRSNSATSAHSEWSKILTIFFAIFKIAWWEIQSDAGNIKEEKRYDNQTSF